MKKAVWNSIMYVKLISHFGQMPQLGGVNPEVSQTSGEKKKQKKYKDIEARPSLIFYDSYKFSNCLSA